MSEPKFEFLFKLKVTLRPPPEIIGVTPDGFRMTGYIVGGTAEGPRLTGQVNPAGADWMRVRSDGVALVDVRTTVQTSDGALMYVHYTGNLDLGPAGLADLMRGVPPASGSRIVTHVHLETGHPAYQDLNRAFAIGYGSAYFERGEVEYDVYKVG